MRQAKIKAVLLRVVVIEEEVVTTEVDEMRGVEIVMKEVVEAHHAEATEEEIEELVVKDN